MPVLDVDVAARLAEDDAATDSTDEDEAIPADAGVALSSPTPIVCASNGTSAAESPAETA